MRAALQLRPVFERIGGAGSASAQIGAVLEFITTCERQQPAETGSGERQRRARAAIVGALTALRDAHARYDDRPLAAAELWATVRRWIEGQTFAPRTGSGGVRLLDAAAAPYAQLDAMRIVGLVEIRLAGAVDPSIFYPAGLLRELGWPADADRLAAARARFDDLLQLPAREIPSRRSRSKTMRSCPRRRSWTTSRAPASKFIGRRLRPSSAFSNTRRCRFLRCVST